MKDNKLVREEGERLFEGRSWKNWERRSGWLVDKRDWRSKRVERETSGDWLWVFGILLISSKSVRILAMISPMDVALWKFRRIAFGESLFLGKL